MKPKYLILALMGMMMIVIAGCATVNRQAKQVFPPQPDDKGLVYFYRERHFVGGGISFNVKENKNILGPAGNGTYFFVIAEPGSHVYEASTEVTSTAVITVEAGKTYYVKCSVEMGAFVGRPCLTIVAPEEGKIRLPSLVYATK
jgi:hypothetical protein